MSRWRRSERRSYPGLVEQTASLTGAKAAEALRVEGFAGEIVLLGAEAERPYERPPLSNDYLRGEAEGNPHVHEDDYYASKGIDLRRSTLAVNLSVEEDVVTLEGGERLA